MHFPLIWKTRINYEEVNKDKYYKLVYLYEKVFYTLIMWQTINKFVNEYNKYLFKTMF